MTRIEIGKNFEIKITEPKEEDEEDFNDEPKK